MAIKTPPKYRSRLITNTPTAQKDATNVVYNPLLPAYSLKDPFKAGKDWNAGVAEEGLESSAAPWEYFMPAASISEGLLAFGMKGLGKLGQYAVKNTILKNAYKLNPLATKTNPEMYLYRTQAPGQLTDRLLEIQNKINNGGILTAEEKIFLKNPQYQKEFQNYGKWFDQDVDKIQYYGNENIRPNATEVLRVKVPTEKAKTMQAINTASAAAQSRRPTKEYILNNEIIKNAQKLDVKDFDQIAKEHINFNTPHWLKGFNK